MDSLAWMLATCRDTALRNLNRAIELATQATNLDPDDADYSGTLGVAQYRAGDYGAAIEALEKALRLRPEGSAADGFFLAMARWQHGDKEQARKDYERAAAFMEKEKSDDEESLRFNQEAAGLLKIAGGDAPK